jgi:creatinine amidohydrolase
MLHRNGSFLLAVAAMLLSQATPAAASRSVFIEDYTTFELADFLAHGRPVALIYNAGVEETGPHIALGKHIFRARAYAERIAFGLGETLVAPIIPYSSNVGTMDAFPGTLNLEPKTVADINEQVARRLIRSGFKVVALLGDHSGAQNELARVARRLDKEFAPKGVRVFFVTDGSKRASTQIDAALIAAGKGRMVGHGGLWDTAETMAVRPQAVRPGLFPRDDFDPRGNGPLDANGVSGSAEDATAELGRSYGALRVRLAIAELRRDLAGGVPIVHGPLKRPD